MHPRLLLAMVGLLLGWGQCPGGAQRVKVLFTPMVCRVHCREGHCANQCERGNATTLYSGENSRPTQGAPGFRVFLCPLICQNGGLCLKKDKCLCPPNWTGKFCHIPALPHFQNQAPTRRGADEASPSERGVQRATKSVYTLPIANHRQERDGVASMVNVHVEHPPEASVTIHQVERVKDEERPPGDSNALPFSRPALYSVLAQSSSREPGGYGEDSGFGYCFRHLRGGECSAPLPGLRTREICCRGHGVAWGVHDCQPCSSGDGGNSGAAGRNEPSCPQGFQRQNGSCVDVDECQQRLYCRNGDCTNTRGSFACVCHEGYILDSSRSSCISHHVISEAKGPCFRVLREGGCSLPILRNITKQICCCSRVGKAWGHGCEGCPPFGSDGFKEICPAGPGYHYSASDLRFDTRYLGQDLPRVPVSHQPSGREPVARLSPMTTAPAILRWSPPPTVLPERQPPWAMPTQSRGPETVAPVAGQGVCERRPQVCGPGRCLPRQGGYTCVCDRGYWLSPQGTHCVDVDECRRSPRPCANGYCENTRGSYSCRCRAGYQADPSGTECRDVDECSRSPSPCARGRCENHPGSYRCACPTGYQTGPTGTECQDVDECRESPPICHPGHCENLPGGYRCTCPIGYQPSPQGTRCVDVDECQQEPPPCGSGRCENVPGGYRCLCPIGFRASLTEDQCLDVDECSAQSPCGPHGHCTNAEGSFHCQCRLGYRTESAEGPCTDINECLEGEFCFPRGECLNTDGSYTCLCAQGFATGPSGASCMDIDECQSSAVCVGGQCANTEGSFSCYCPPGTRSSPDKASCDDIDECQQYGSQACGDRRCENTLGSYQCVASCQSGFQATAAGDCVDVDECQNTSLCGVHAVCHNLPGSFQCICDQGYESARDGHHCLDVNECETLQGVCGAAPCENVEGSFLCICPGPAEEFDPMTGRCLRPPGAPVHPPAFPRRPEASVLEPPPSGPSEGTRRECYYDPNAAQACENVLAWNATRQECCCSLGHGWGLDCHIQECPLPGTVEFQTLCPHGSGFAAVSPGAAHSALADVDECSLFSSQVCKGGVCVNKVPGYSCYCPSGYYYETQHLECIDNDECLDEEAEPCVGGRCVNTIGSYYCSCGPPLVLDASQHRCVTNDSQDANLAMCWQEVGPDLVCSRPRLDRQVTYTECCCLYGEAWSMDCALCPARDSEDFEALCNVLRPPSYGPVRPGGLGLPFEYGGGEFVPYGPEIFAPPARPAPRLPDYDPYPRDSLYGPPPYEANDFEDPSYGDARPEGFGEPPHRGYPAHGPPEPEWHYPPRSSSSRGAYERPGRASEDYRRVEDFGAAHSEECGILSGCENGRCVRVADGFTCLCHEGYRLDLARMACLDIDECLEEEGLCPGGECFNTDGLYRCLCPRGTVPVGQPPRCAPAPRSQG